MNKKSLIVLGLVAVVIAGTIASQQPMGTANDAIAQPTTLPESSEVVETTSVPVEPKNLKPVLDHPALDNAPLDGDYVMGSEDAPVTLIEYASLSCPHCADFHNRVLPELKKKYIETGKVRYILRQFPLNEPAMMGAMLVHCVGESGGKDRYFQFNEVLFGAQSKWAFDAKFKESLRVFAEVGGVSAGDFDRCVNNMEREKRILITRKIGSEELKIDGTPYIFLNGRAHGGNKSVKAVSRDIDYLLFSQQ